VAQALLKTADILITIRNFGCHCVPELVLIKGGHDKVNMEVGMDFRKIQSLLGFDDEILSNMVSNLLQPTDVHEHQLESQTTQLLLRSFYFSI
jgi:hypothetical protein